MKVVGGKGLAQSSFNTNERTIRTGETREMGNGLFGIRYNIEKANRTDRRVQNLAPYINVETLKEAHRKMDSKKALGWDNVSKEDYSVNLESNLDHLINRMKRGSYRPEASRRTYIPKEGNPKGRPLGISCYEDKLVENVIAGILGEVYEPKFLDSSYGFRPKRNCHSAIREIIEMVQYRKTNYVVEADIRAFFDSVDHTWLIKFLEHDIADRRFIEIIQKFLDAGIMEEGKFLNKEKGVPQGNGASPVLANVYLHYVLDLWFEKKVKLESRGEAYLIRYCDDFVCCFQHESDAKKFYDDLIERFAKFGLEIAEDKTKILEFGRFAKKNREARGQGKPETFDFLGFTFYCGTDSWKRFFRCRVKSSRKRMRRKIKETKEWIKWNRTLEVSELIKKLNQKLQGYYQYYAVTDNLKEVKRYRNAVIWLLYKWLNRRSQRRSYTIDTFFNGLLRSNPLVEPRVKVSLFYR
jgi:group II intron reverse transcriptase/maturase